MDSDFNRSKLKLAREQAKRVTLARNRAEKEEKTKAAVTEGIKAMEALAKERKLKARVASVCLARCSGW